MSMKDSTPAVQPDTARPVYPVMFFGKEGQDDPTMTDWRATVLPADAPEEEQAPKASSAPEPADSSESPVTSEQLHPAGNAQTPVVKVTTQLKVASPGSPTSSAPTKSGSSGPTVKARP